MNGQIMVVCIVLITVVFGTIFDMYKKHLAFKEKMLKHNHSSDADNQQLKQQVINLEARIQVLEKIVTDEGYAVQKEINGL